MDCFYSLETRSIAERESWLAVALPRQIVHARRVAPYFARLLAGVDPTRVTGRAALAETIVGSLREVIKLRGKLEFAAPGGLPNEGRVIDATQKFD